MVFESCNSAAQFAFTQSQNTFIIPNETPFIEFCMNMLATGDVELAVRIFDVTQPLSFAVFNRVDAQKFCCLEYWATKFAFSRHFFSNKAGNVDFILCYFTRHTMAETVKSLPCIFSVSQSTFLRVLQKITAWVMVRVSYKSHRVSNFQSSLSTEM